MTPTCCAYGCLNRFEKGTGLGFYRFPKQKSRRILWTLAVRRQNFIPNNNTRICGDHFVTGKPSKNMKHPDYIPTIFNYNPLHTTGRFRKKLCDLQDLPVLTTVSGSSSEEDSGKEDVETDVMHSDIKEEICDPSDITDEMFDQSDVTAGMFDQSNVKEEVLDQSKVKIHNVKSVGSSNVHNPSTATSSTSSPSETPGERESFVFIDTQGRVLARFMKERMKWKESRYPMYHKRKPIVTNPESVRIVFENNVARIVADE